jgi:hypothetical protein
MLKERRPFSCMIYQITAERSALFHTINGPATFANVVLCQTSSRCEKGHILPNTQTKLANVAPGLVPGGHFIV